MSPMRLNAPDGSRYLQYTVTSSAKTATYSVDKLAEHVTAISSGIQTDTDRSYVGPAVVIGKAAGVRTANHLHLDRLGSVQTITGPSAAEVMTDAHGMDAFGKPRDREWMDNGSKLHPTGGGVTNHGFTGHEHLDDTFLIHMNGRVYDYRLGRFLSVDPIISNPANSQSINPYSYIGNNPLSGVDPTGYKGVCTGNAETCPASIFENELKYSSSSWMPAGSTKSSGSKSPGKTTPAGPPNQTGAPGANKTDDSTAERPASSTEQGKIRQVDQGVPTPDTLVPITTDLNKEAVSLTPQVQMRSDGDEEALTANARGKTLRSSREECSDMRRTVHLIEGAVLGEHNHKALKSDSNDREEMPGPGDYEMILRWNIPSYIVTPTSRLVGFEFNEYGGQRGCYFNYIGRDGSVESGPFLWDPKKVE